MVMAWARAATNPATSGTSPGERPRVAMRCTTALPTTMASACWATARACSGFEIPNPTAMGIGLCRRMVAVICPMVSLTFDCMPVTPSRLT